MARLADLGSVPTEPLTHWIGKPSDQNFFVAAYKVQRGGARSLFLFGWLLKKKAAGLRLIYRYSLPSLGKRVTLHP